MTDLDRRRILQLAAATALLPSRSARAQAYPSKTIRMVTPFAAGASTDLLARSVAAGLTKQFGQQVIVDIKPGAGGSLAASEVARAPADGYTFLLSSAGIVTMNQSIYRKLPYDPIKDFAPLTVAVRMPILLVSHPERPYKTIQEFIAYAKANPGKVSYGSAGTGTSQHMAGELFKSMAKVDLLHVPYKGGAPAMVDLVGGQIDAMFVQLPSALPQLKANRIRALAVGSPKRAAQLPQVPTVSEVGVTGYDSDTWYGFVAPAATPVAVIDKLHAAIEAALRENVAQFNSEGFEVDASSPKSMGETIRTESAKWAQVVREAKIAIE